MSEAFSDDGNDPIQEDGDEDVMTPAELIAKLEEVSRRQPMSPQLTHVVFTNFPPVGLSALALALLFMVCVRRRG